MSSKVILCLFLAFCVAVWASAKGVQEDYESIGSDSCRECHETGEQEVEIAKEIEKSSHSGMECLDCHTDKGTMPHKETRDFSVGMNGCAECHTDAAEQYQFHGYLRIENNGDLPSCADCHGSHDILVSSDDHSKTHPANLPVTCSLCHKDLDLIEKYHIRTDHPVEVYTNSIHSQTIKEGQVDAATCNDCHSSGGTAHKIFSPNNPESTINHFNIPKTCGKCHKEIEKEFWEGIHGQFVARGDTESPVCTHCHGEHGIISPRDPRSPVSRVRLAEATCTPCHESISMTEKYRVETDRIPSFIDNFHGLKSKAGDLVVANCASCHEAHLILPSSNPRSSIHPDNLQETCGECHPGITKVMASESIHGFGEKAAPSKLAGTIQKIYIVLIIAVIGAMALHWIIDFFRQIILVMKKRQVRRMTMGEVWQHALLMVSFIVLVISGFALRYNESWITKFFFGWQHGFELRGIIHRVAAVLLISVTCWHLVYLFSRRGKRFLMDMFPNLSDLKHLFQRMLFNLGLSKQAPQFKRFSYVEKAEYWALIWGNIVMILTGLVLWFDNILVRFLPKEAIDVSLVIHYYEAILASLAILVWHLYSTVFNPHVYPMNPSWLTGKMPEKMFKHEHPDAEIEEAEQGS